MREIFVSYHHKDRKLVGRLGTELRRYRLRPFLAHENLVVSSRWREEILRHIDTCTALIAVVTKNFYNSDWTSQELGIAIGKEKPILSLILENGIKPHGFMESFQYVRCSKDSLDDALRRMTKFLDAARLSRKTLEAYKGLAGILNLLLLTWENRKGNRRDSYLPFQTVAEVRDHFSTRAEQLSETISLNRADIDPKVISSFRSLIKTIDEYTAFRSDDYAELERIGEKVFLKGTKLMRWLRDRIPTSWQKQWLDPPSE